jgi:hypothetical protein
MSARWESPQLLQPITEERPCGENLEDTELLASFDAFRLFGQARPLDASAEPDEKRIPAPERRRGQIRDKALSPKSKDLRLLAPREQRGERMECWHFRDVTPFNG